MFEALRQGMFSDKRAASKRVSELIKVDKLSYAEALEQAAEEFRFVKDTVENYHRRSRRARNKIGI